MKEIEILFKYLDKFFRFLLPGFIGIILTKIYLPCFYSNYFEKYVIIINIYVSFPFVSLFIYLIHRFVYEFIDLLIVKCFFKENIGESYFITSNISDKINLRIEYHFSLIHSLLIISELGLIISCFSNFHKCISMISFSLLLIASFLLYIIYHKIAYFIRYNNKTDNNI